MRTLLTIALFMTVLPMAAQNISVEGFSRQKKSLVKNLKVAKDKKNATLLLTTDEKGFKFKANAETDVKAEEGDGLLTLKVPHKTQWLTITHPDYGQQTWQVPGKGLRKRKTYHAYLQTYNPNKEYKLQKQWVVFQTDPRNAIVHVDSVMTAVRNGEAQYHLPLGKHPYRVEAPFFEAVEDTLELTDEQKLILPVKLQPVYSYLIVRTPYKSSRIYVDNEMIGQHEAESGHLAPGNHRLSVFIGSLCFYDAPLVIDESTKKVVELTYDDFREKPWHVTPNLAAMAADSTSVSDSIAVSDSTRLSAPLLQANVTIQAADDDTEIWVDRVLIGKGSWKGKLDEGFHIINSEKEGLESAVHYLWVKDEFPLEVNLGAPQADLGFLNIHSNVIGAAAYVNDSLMGKTPCIVENLLAGKTYAVRLEHPSYKPVKQKVLVLGNDLVDVEMRMKKSKKAKK